MPFILLIYFLQEASDSIFHKTFIGDLGWCDSSPIFTGADDPFPYVTHGYDLAGINCVHMCCVVAIVEINANIYLQ